MNEQQQIQLNNYLSLVWQYLKQEDIKHFNNVTKNVIQSIKLPSYIKLNYNYKDSMNECIFMLVHKIEIDIKRNKEIKYLDNITSFHKFFTMFIKNTINFDFLDCKNFKTSTKLFDYIYKTDLINFDTGNSYEEDKNLLSIYINAENVDDYTKLYMLDMLNNDLPIDSSIKLKQIDKIKKTLNAQEQDMFDMYYIQDMSIFTIFNYLKDDDKQKLSIGEIRKRIKSIKDKIKITVELLKDDY